MLQPYIPTLYEIATIIFEQIRIIFREQETINYIVYIRHQNRRGEWVGIT